MRALIRLFFRTLRLVLNPFMLLWAKLAMPRGVVREAKAQQAVDLACSKMALYHYPTCPFCIKVLHEMGRLSLPIELRDAQHDATHRETLLQSGGKVQVPCLRISDVEGQVQWLYESNDIIRYLQQRFA
ncbi:MAG TPA: glutathione S-transferase N-terminal domain-containing protein [Gallionella sp.]|nr:glutathione S-transferase N-terminal domain-containing protein [Gallionella sp.]